VKRIVLAVDLDVVEPADPDALAFLLTQVFTQAIEDHAERYATLVSVRVAE
jgi:hypothetical protein